MTLPSFPRLTVIGDAVLTSDLLPESPDLPLLRPDFDDLPRPPRPPRPLDSTRTSPRPVESARGSVLEGLETEPFPVEFFIESGVFSLMPLSSFKLVLSTGMSFLGPLIGAEDEVEASKSVLSFLVPFDFFDFFAFFFFSVGAEEAVGGERIFVGGGGGCCWLLFWCWICC